MACGGGSGRVPPVFWNVLLCLVLLAGIVEESAGQGSNEYHNNIGGEIATLNEMPFLDETYENFTNSHRQDLCGQYDLVRKGQLELRDALRGLDLTAVFIVDQYFHYSEDTGIDPEDPGLVAVLMDMIADRSGFTWRNSFAVVKWAAYYNMSWTELLWWEVNAYDISPSYWDHSLRRMEMGIAFTEPWYDGSIILVDKLEENELFSNNIDKWALLNWTKPFDQSVWLLIFITVFASGLVYQLIEYIQGDQQDRPFSQWFMDNQYLSLLNFAQNFEYAPYTGPGRIFAFSMAFWALVISAAYTANLASLLVSHNHHSPVVSSIEEAAAKKIPICTFEGTNADELLKRWYATAERRPKSSSPAMFEALQSGECDLVAESMDGWNSFKEQRVYNPNCNVQRVGRTIDEIKSGFALKADVGYKCTSLIRDVFDLHFQELINDGELRNAWAMHRARIRDIDCNAATPEAAGYGEEEEDHHSNSYYESQGGGRRDRNLRSKSGDTSSQSSHHNQDEDGEGGIELELPFDEESLTVEQMAGAFALHYALMIVAIVISLVSPYWTRLTVSLGWEQPEQVIVRSHGPTVGPCPTVDVDSRRSTTIIQAYGSPIANKRVSRLSINTYVRPSKGPDQVDTAETNRAEFQDEPSYSSNSSNGLPMDMVKANRSQREHSEERVVATATLSHLQDHIVKLQRANERLEERFSQCEHKLNQQTGMMVTMLEDAKRREEIRHKELHDLLMDVKMKEIQQQHRDPHLPVGVPIQNTTEEVKKDFGHYLRKGTEKRDFGQYLYQNS